MKYKQAETIKGQLDEILANPVTRRQIGFDEAVITIIPETGEPEFEKPDKFIDPDDLYQRFNVLLISYNENGTTEACDYSEPLIKRLLNPN